MLVAGSRCRVGLFQSFGVEPRLLLGSESLPVGVDPGPLFPLAGLGPPGLGLPLPFGPLPLGSPRPTLETGRRRVILPDRLGKVGTLVRDLLRSLLTEPIDLLDLGPDQLLGEVTDKLGGHAPRHATNDKLLLQAGR